MNLFSIANCSTFILDLGISDLNLIVPHQLRFEKSPPQLEKNIIIDIRRNRDMPLEMPSKKKWERFVYKQT